MSSVRVRRNTVSYAPLPEGNTTIPLHNRKSLAAIFHGYTSPAEPASVGPSNAPDTTFTRSRRPQDHSKVTQHVLQDIFPADVSPTTRRATHPPLTSSPPRSRRGSDVMTIEGSQANVVLSRNSHEPGLIGSALTLSEPDQHTENDENHHDDIVEHLDVIDSQVATVATLANAANAILIPPLPLYSRKPVVELSSPISNSRRDRDVEKADQAEDALDRHVEEVLKKPSTIRRTLAGVWSFLKTPIGIIAGIYGFLVVFWGAAIVIFLLKIINFHNKTTQGFWVEVSSQVENALFTVTGVGLIPPRLMDTYRILKIWHYKRRTRQLRERASLPPLVDENDLPDPAYDHKYVHVLSEKEQRDLHYQQVCFKENQTWYRPHGTATHRAFPINTALLVCLLNDGNSFFQIILCACMWSMNRFIRPAWTTGSLIPLSFLCGIFSAVFIARGGAKTKRTKEVAERLQAVLAADKGDRSSVRRTQINEVLSNTRSLSRMAE